MKKDSVLQIRLPLQMRESFLACSEKAGKTAGVLLREFIEDFIAKSSENLSAGSESNNVDWIETEEPLYNFNPSIEDYYSHFLNLIEEGKIAVNTAEQEEVINKIKVRFEKKLLNYCFFPFYEMAFIQDFASFENMDCMFEIFRDKGMYRFEAEFVSLSSKKKLPHKLSCYYKDNEFRYESINSKTGDKVENLNAVGCIRINQE